MLLNALHDRAVRKKLSEQLPFQRRMVHLLIPLDREGQLRGSGLVALHHEDSKGKPQLGREFLLPRFPGENNGGKAYFLAENFAAVLGIRKETGEPLPVEPTTAKDRNPVQAFRHFWQRIADANGRKQDPRLEALLRFRETYLKEAEGVRAGGLPFVDLVENARTKERELAARTDDGSSVTFKKANTVSFEVDGRFIFSGAPDDPLWVDWAAVYYREAYTDDQPAEEESTAASGRVCLITGEAGRPIARSHKPKILGVPGLSSGGYVVSFARQAPAFSSFGFTMGENAPVSQEAAAAYALALNDLLASEDTSFRVGEVAFCFWTEDNPNQGKRLGALLSQPKSKSVAEFLKTPFAGIERPLARKDQFFSVALSGNAGRVVVRHWLRRTLEQAIENLRQWFEQLEIVELPSSLTARESTDQSSSSPYSILRLAAATVPWRGDSAERRDSPELKKKGDLIGQLYRAAVEGETPPLALLVPVLQELRAALACDSPRRPRFPLNPSRFALIKLILLRNHRGGFMPIRHLADTDDAPYNLGRLLSILASLQAQAHEYKLEGPGIVERYYGTASSAPATVFGILVRLHQHHLRKLDQQGAGEDALAIRARLADLMGRFPPSGPGKPPEFPAQLTLEEQGRFALGFYQQKAADL